MNLKAKVKVLTLSVLMCALWMNSIAQGKTYKSYSIQIASYSKVLEDVELATELKRFESLSNLGHIYETSYISPSHTVPTKLFLGSYIGEHTAKKILAQVKRKGFKDSFIIGEYKSIDPDESGHYEIVQLASSKIPRMALYKNIFNDYGEGYVQLVLGKDGKYKTVINSFKSGDTTAEMADAKRYGFQGWKRKITDVYKSKSKPKQTAVKE